MWRGAPYQPLPNDAPLTAPLDPHLATEQRAAERSEFDKAVAEKIRQQEVCVRVCVCVCALTVPAHTAHTSECFSVRLT